MVPICLGGGAYRKILRKSTLSGQVAYPTAAYGSSAQHSPDEVHHRKQANRAYKGGVYVLDKDVLTSRYKDRTASRRITSSTTPTPATLTHDGARGGGTGGSERRSEFRLRTAPITCRQPPAGSFYDVTRARYGDQDLRRPSTERCTPRTARSCSRARRSIKARAGGLRHLPGDGDFVPDCRSRTGFFSADHISLANNVARAHNSVFHLFNCSPVVSALCDASLRTRMRGSREF